MIQNYLYTIGKYIPPSQREDVLKEIESNLYDMLEEKFGIKDYSKKEIEIVIRAMGHPKKVAEAYMDSPRYLIGPAYLDTYWMVIKISILGTAIGLAVSQWIFITSVAEGMQMMLSFIAQICQAGFILVGIITLIFAAIQYYNPQPSSMMMNKKEWWLRLSKAPDPKHNIDRFELMVETFFIYIFLVSFYRIPHFLNSNSVISLDPLFPYFMCIVGCCGAILLLHLYLLIKGYWQPFTRVLSIGMETLIVVIVANVLFRPEIVALFSLMTVKPNHLWFYLFVCIALIVIVTLTGLKISRHFQAIRKKQ